MPLMELNSALEDSGPYLVEDGTRIYFDSGRTRPWSVYMANWDSASRMFLPPVTLPELGPARDPCLSPDEQYIVYARSVGGANDLFEAFR